MAADPTARHHSPARHLHVLVGESVPAGMAGDDTGHVCDHGGWIAEPAESCGLCAAAA